MDINDVLHANAVRLLVTELGGHLLDSRDLGDYALEYATRGWPVFPLNLDKSPATRHGLLDATTNLAQVTHWWSGPYRGASIGIRLPVNLFVIDIDPRNGGLPQWEKLVGKHGQLPDTMTVWSGRGDGGRHYYLQRLDLESRMSTRGLRTDLQLGPDEKLGIDVKTNSGYVVAAPSPHPATGRPYRLESEKVIAQCPQWLWYWLTHTDAPPRPQVTEPKDYDDTSPADWYTAHASWRSILEPHGWNVVGYDGDSEGSMWRHPAATSPCSATVRNECLFVYSPNTPFEVTEAGMPYGYTKFRAFAVLNFNGDMTVAAFAVADMRRRMRL